MVAFPNISNAQYIVLQDLTELIDNHDFKAGTPVIYTIRTYDYDIPDQVGFGAGGEGLYGQQEVPGWTAANPSDNKWMEYDTRTDGSNSRAAGVFAYDLDSEIGLGGDYFPRIEGGDTQGLGMVAVWGANLAYSQHISLPAGDYLLIAKVCNVAGTGKVSNNFGFKVDDETYYRSKMNIFLQQAVLESKGKDCWIEDTVIFRLTAAAEGDILLGYSFGAGSGSAPHLFVDNVRLLKVDPSGLDQQQIAEAKATLKQFIDEGQRLRVETSASESVYNNPNATLAQVQAAIEKQKALNADAITDLSEFFIMNPHFSMDDPITDGICTYDCDMEKNGVTHYGMQPVKSWVANHPATNTYASGVLETGTTAWIGGTQFTPPATLSDGSTGKLLGFVTCWTGSIQYTQHVNLPAGSYMLTISYYNTGGASAVAKNLIGFITDDGVEYLGDTKSFPDGEWGKETITFELMEETAGNFSLGYTSTNTGSGNMPHLFLDGISLYCIGDFIIPQYRIIYLVDGLSYKTSLVNFKSQIIPEDAPTKEGYTFSGWSEIPSTMPNHDVVVNGTFNVNSYRLTYIVDGERVSEEDIAYNSYLSLKEEPTKEGYTFSGWSEIPETMPAHNVTVTGTFSINSYKLTYVLDGTTYSEEEIEYNTALTPKEALAKEGYTFSGWSEIPETMPAHDVTITGEFTINSYKLTYILDGETFKEVEVDYGSTITPEEALEKEGYTFSGWSEIPETMPAHDVVVTASFTKGQYKLIYMVDGQVYKTFSNDYQNGITPEASPVREGYAFSGWDEVPETMPAHDVIVNGTFTINTYTVTYLLDGEEYESFEIVYGGAVPTVETPEKEHHTFSGWSEIPETMPARDVVITGSLVLDTYKVIYKINDVVYKTVVVGYGLPITPEPAPEKEGYTFSGWSWIPSKMPAEDVIVTAKFTPIKYDLVYMVDGIEYKTYQVDYDSSITPEPKPQREGYTFSGWSWIPSRMPAERVVITGSFSVNHYTITYVIDDETYDTEVLDYGTPINPPEAPERAGSTFSWIDVPETMPAHDITIVGSYTDGIVAIDNGKSTMDNTVIYNLSGQRLSKPQRGVNIIDGKKVIVK